MGIKFDTKTTRRRVQMSLLTTALHIVIVIGGSATVTYRYGGETWLVAALSYGGFLSVSLIWWVSRQLVAWLVWRIIWRSAAVGELVAAFEHAKFPKPSPYMSSAENYFQEIINDESTNLPMRFGAVRHYLYLTEFATEHGFWFLLRITTLYEESIAAYRASFRRE